MAINLCDQIRTYLDLPNYIFFILCCVLSLDFLIYSLVEFGSDDSSSRSRQAVYRQNGACGCDEGSRRPVTINGTAAGNVGFGSGETDNGNTIINNYALSKIFCNTLLSNNVSVFILISISFRCLEHLKRVTNKLKI